MNKIYADEPLKESIGTPAEREAKLNKRIAELEGMLSAADTIDASRLKEITELEKFVDEMKESHEDIVNEVMSVGGYPESTPNAVGRPVSTEPTPVDMVEWLVSKYNKQNRRIDELQAALNGE